MRVGAKFGHRRLGRSFERWVSESVGRRWEGDELKTLRSTVRRQRRSVFERAILRMSQASTARCFVRWRNTTRQILHATSTMDRVVRRLGSMGLHRAFERWREFARQVSQSVSSSGAPTARQAGVLGCSLIWWVVWVGRNGC